MCVCAILFFWGCFPCCLFLLLALVRFGSLSVAGSVLSLPLVVCCPSLSSALWCRRVGCRAVVAVGCGAGRRGRAVVLRRLRASRALGSASRLRFCLRFGSRLSSGSSAPRSSVVSRARCSASGCSVRPCRRRRRVRRLAPPLLPRRLCTQYKIKQRRIRNELL